MINSIIKKLTLDIMINLLFNNAAQPDQKFSLMNTKTNVIEVVLFEAYPGYTKEEVETALASLNDIVKLYYGFVERTTASNRDGKYIDIVYWADMKSAKEAATDLVKNPVAAAVFNIIKSESVKMYHFDTFNQFEE